MKIELVTSTENAELLIERAMRICHGGDVDPEKGANKTFIQNIIKLGHESPLEHGVMTFKITDVSRSLTHQLVRHRIASYTQKSQRYCKENQFGYVTPKSIQDNPEIYETYKNLMATINHYYELFVNSGIRREDARYILPNACYTDIWVTMNFRELRNFFKLRCHKTAQWEIRDMAKEMLKIAFEKYPIVFEDLYNQYIELRSL